MLLILKNDVINIIYFLFVIFFQCEKTNCSSWAEMVRQQPSSGRPGRPATRRVSDEGSSGGQHLWSESSSPSDVVVVDDDSSDNDLEIVITATDMPTSASSGPFPAAAAVNTDVSSNTSSSSSWSSSSRSGQESSSSVSGGGGSSTSFAPQAVNMSADDVEAVAELATFLVDVGIGRKTHVLKYAESLVLMKKVSGDDDDDDDDDGDITFTST
jgi:hypothetical protein